MTEESTRSMTEIALQGGRWVALQSFGVQFLSVFTTALLARLLAPEDFGIIAVASVLVALFALVNTFGINASVVRRRDVDDTLVSTFFWLALGLGAVATAVLATASGPLASSFGQAGAAPYVAALAPVMLLSLLRSVPTAVLSRELRFGAVAAIGVIDFISYVSVAIALAAAFDLGAWSVVLGRLVAGASSMLSAFVLSRWRPRAEFSWLSIRKDIAFNATMVVNGVIAFASRNIDYWVVGRLGTATLGIYYIAYVIPNVLKRRLSIVGTNVMFPILSRITDDRERLGRGFLDSTRLITLIGFPLMFGLAAVSDGVIPLLFGSEYQGAVRPASIIAVAAGVSVIISTTAPVFIADGVPQKSAVVGAVRLVVIAVGLAMTYSRGTLTGVAWAVFAGIIAAVAVSQLLVVPSLPISGRDVVASIAPATVSSLVMVAAVTGTKRLLGDTSLEWPGLISVVLIGVATYLAFGFVAYRSAFLRLFKNLKLIVTS